MSVLLLLGACGGGGGTGAGVASGGVTTITGSSGDGPIIGGAITVTDGKRNAVTTTPANPKTDLTAHYSFTISPTTPLPITVTIKGGKDKVTGAPQDFTLTSISSTPLAASGTVDLNINPLSTLIAASASAKGALNATTLAAATTNVLNTMGFGLPAGFDPQSTKVGTANVASVVKANEAAAELIRRTGVSTGKSMANTITAIAEDLTDGVLDGKVAAGVTASQATANTAGVIMTKQAEISAAILAGKLKITDKTGAIKVTDANMTSKLNAAILITQPNTTGNAADVSKVKVTQKFIDQTINAVSQSSVLFGGSIAKLNNLEATIHALSATTAPSTQQAADIIIALNNAQSDINTATGNAQSGAGTVTTTTTNSAPVFTGTPAISGTVAVNNILSLTSTAASDADGNMLAFSYQWNANGAVIAGATGKTYKVSVGNAGKKITAVITVNDGQKAANSATSVVTAGIIDTVAPTLAITSNVSALKAGQTATISFTFSEVPTGFVAADVTTTNGTISTPTVTIGNAKLYIATFTPAVSLASGSASITVAAGAYTDAAGNSGGAGTTPSITIDTVAPTLAITSNVSALKAGQTATISFTFSEVPTGFVAADVTTTNGILSTPTVTSNTKVYTSTFTPSSSLASGSASITVAAGAYTDAAGNSGGAGTTPSIIIDTVAPTQTFSVLSFSADTGTSTSDFITKTAAQTISATLSAALATGDKVFGSLNGGTNWTVITTKVSGTTLSWTGVILTASNTLKLKVQ